MIIYEVQIKINQSVLSDYKSWLESHIEEILKIEGFIKAELLEEMKNPNCLKVLYYLRSQEDLDHYFKFHAPQLRNDGIKKFEGKFEITRNNYQIIDLPLKQR